MSGLAVEASDIAAARFAIAMPSVPFWGVVLATPALLAFYP